MTSDIQQIHRKLAETLRANPKTSTQLRQGVITAVDPATFTCTVALGGDTTNTIAGVAFLHSGYLPGVNDTVWILQTGTDLLIIGGHETRYGTLTWLTQSVGANTFTTSSGAETFDTDMWLTVPVIQGFKYKLELHGRIDVSVNATAWAQRLRISAISGSPSNPTTSSTQVGGTVGYNSQSGGGGEQSCHGFGYFVASSTGSLIVGGSVARIGAGTGEISIRAPETNTPVTLDAYCMGIP
jgi:hypothetical protein